MQKLKFEVKSIIFDMDGVITNTMPDHYSSWKHVLKQYDVHVSYHDVYLREGQSGIKAIDEIMQKYQKRMTKKQLYDILQQKEEHFKKIVKTRYISGARTFLKNLYRENFLLALVTGTSKHELKKILPSQLFDLFATVVTADDVKHGKPNPEPYQKALKHMNIVPSEAVVIENAPCGIQSAKKAKMKCLALETSLPKVYLSQADFIFPSIKILRQKVTFHRI